MIDCVVWSNETYNILSHMLVEIRNNFDLTFQVVMPSKMTTISTPIVHHQPTHHVQSEPSSESRKRSDIDFDAFTDVKRRKTEKGGKGLRHFSMKVCEKVQAKGSTSYNEVADELVNELTDPR